MNKNSNSATILVIDDTPANVSLLFTALEESGYRVLIAKRGEDGIESAELAKPDLILLDVMMPGIDGFETCIRLKAKEVTSDIPVIFITALTDSFDKIRGFEAGGVDFVSKPFDIEEVLQRIHTHLTLRILQKELRETNKNLEVKVEERTRELEESNIALRKEIEERKEIEKQLLEAKQQAELSDKLKSEFLGQISHEIRTPINALTNLVDLLQYQLPDDKSPDIVNTGNLIIQSGERLIRTIDLIILMSQIRAGTYDKEYETIDIYAEILHDQINVYREKCRSKELFFESIDSTSRRTIKGDRNSLNKIFEQLLDNAYTFTESGTIELHIYNDEDVHTVSVAIKDTGIGISDEFLEKIFEPFAQEDQGYTRKYEGVGLGLSLVKLLCQMNNADISVKSEKDEGSVFTVTFPLEG